MAWSPEARRAALIARRRKSRGRRKAKQYKKGHGAIRNNPGARVGLAVGKTVGKVVPKRAKSSGNRKATRNRRLKDKKKRIQKRTVKRVNKQVTKVSQNLFTDGSGNVYTNTRGLRAGAKAQRIATRGNKKMAKIDRKIKKSTPKRRKRR